MSSGIILMLGLFIGFFAGLQANLQKKVVAPAPVEARAPMPVAQAPAAPATKAAEAPAKSSFENLSLVEMHAQCAAAEKTWLEKNLESYAAKASEPEASKRLFAQLKEPLKTASWWRGEVAFPEGENNVKFEVILKIYGSHEAELGDPFKSDALARIILPDELCYALTIFITAQSKMDSASFSTCAGPERKKGNSYFIQYNAYAEEKLAPAASLVLIPFPVQASSPLEYLATLNAQWVPKPEFSWRPSNYGEWQELHEQYLKSFEHP